MAQKHLIHFGYWIFAQRMERGWSRRVLAEKADVSERYVNRVERRATTDGMHPHTLSGLATAFGISANVLRTEWRKSPVPVPAFRKPRVTPLWTLCNRYGVDRAVAIESMSRWLLDQPEGVQKAALGLANLPSARTRKKAG